MGMTELKTHYDKVQRIKFFCKKHQQIVEAFDGIRASTWTHPADDEALFDNMNAVLRAIENKMLEKIK